MKIQRLEAHDRLLHLKEDQALNVAQGAEDCLKKNPLSLALQEHSDYVYLFAHPRTAEDGVTKRMIWQPRLSKPKAQTNSYLFRAKSHSHDIEVCWLIPERFMWTQYKKGNVTENELVLWCINQFEYHREDLERADPMDLKDDQVKNIYRAIAHEMDGDRRIKSLHPTQESLDA